MTGTPNNSHPIHHQNGNGVIKKNGIHDVGGEPGHISSSSSTSTLTGQRGPIPLTIKTLEAENKRKTLLAEVLLLLLLPVSAIHAIQMSQHALMKVDQQKLIVTYLLLTLCGNC